MDSNKVEGAAKEFVGRLQDGAGGLLGDTATQARGKVNQATGQAQQAYGDVLETVRDLAADQPLVAVAAAAGVGFVLGAIFARL